MSLLKNPNEINEDVKLAGLIYGQPGVGKTTLALSGPTPVLIDADEGLRRVEKRFQVPSLPLTNYKDFLALLESNELQPFEMIVVDTMGRLIDRMGDHLIAGNPKFRNPATGGLSLPGFGAVRTEFQRLLREVKKKGKHILFVAHEKEEKDADTRIVRPDVAGSAGKDLVKDLDFMGYMEMRGNKRTISFSPSEKYYAKNSLQLEQVIEVPDTANGNSFVKMQILDRAIARLKADDEANKLYVALIAQNDQMIGSVKDAGTADSVLVALNNAQVIWDSARVAKHKLAEKAKSLGLEYDKAEKKFKIGAASSTDEQRTVNAPPNPQVGSTPTPPTKPKPPVAPANFATLVDSLINGIAECKTEKSLDAYIKAQASDIGEIASKATIELQLKYGDAVLEKRKSFEKKAA